MDAVVETLVTELQTTPTSHAATMGPFELERMGLPVVMLDPCGWEWELLWRLWTLYWVQIGGPIYESRTNSFRPFIQPPA
jgi:hypothetical protein